MPKPLKHVFIRAIINLGRELIKMPITAKEMVKFLKNNGFERMSQSGTQLKMRNHTTGKIVIVPMHRGDLPNGTEKVILKEAGLKK